MEDMLKGTLPGDQNADQAEATSAQQLEAGFSEEKGNTFTAVILSVFMVAIAILFAVLYFADESFFKDDTFLQQFNDQTALVRNLIKIG